MEKSKDRTVRHGRHHLHEGEAVPVRPHRHDLDDGGSGDAGPGDAGLVPEDDAPHPHPPRGPSPPPPDPARDAAANRHALRDLGIHAALIEGAGAAALVAALLPGLAGTPAAVIAGPGVDAGALPALPVARLSGPLDARAVGLAMDDLRLAPASFLFLLGPGGAPDLGQDLRLSDRAEPRATAHLLMEGLAARAR